MILNINETRYNAKYIVKYYKRTFVNNECDVYIDFASIGGIRIECYNNEAVADAVLHLIDDAFENEINLTYINSEHIKGNLERADKDAF